MLEKASSNYKENVAFRLPLNEKTYTWQLVGSAAALERTPGVLENPPESQRDGAMSAPGGV